MIQVKRKQALGIPVLHRLIEQARDTRGDNYNSTGSSARIYRIERREKHIAQVNTRSGDMTNKPQLNCIQSNPTQPQSKLQNPGDKGPPTGPRTAAGRDKRNATCNAIQHRRYEPRAKEKEKKKVTLLNERACRSPKAAASVMSPSCAKGKKADDTS